jgi:hypothetical protein
MDINKGGPAGIEVPSRIHSMPLDQQAYVENKSVKDKNGPTGKEVSSEKKNVAENQQAQKDKETAKDKHREVDLLENEYGSLQRNSQ